MQGLTFARRPPNYSPPGWKDVERLRNDLRKMRERKLGKITQLKRARRDEWEGVLQQIPMSYRKMAPVLGFPDLAEMGQRIAGMISQHPPLCEVVPPSGSLTDIRKAAGEEARLHAARITIQDQQSRDIYAMGIDAQVHWSESWISVMPDSQKMAFDEDDEEGYSFRRKKDESAEEYLERSKNMMADGCVPIKIEDHDPQTVLPLRVAGGENVAVIIESEHEMFSIELGLGYKPLKNEEGTVLEWVDAGYTLGTPRIVNEAQVNSPAIVDTTHDNPLTDNATGASSTGKKIVKTIYMDQWCYQMYLDQVLVEAWEHNWGIVPMFGAYAEQSSDQEPGEESRAVIEGALVLAKQVVLWAAMLTSNAKLHGFPTPFVKNPQHGVTWAQNEPITRPIRLGEMNFLGPNEEIEFPYLQAQMGPDFYKNLEFLMARLEGLTMQSWGQNLSPETSGYAIAQIRSLQHSILGPVYANAAQQWRKIYAFIRWLVKNVFKAGIHLRGAIEVKEVEGTEYQYAPILTYAEKDVTDFTINVNIEEGVVQDELALRKSAIELGQAGYWSPRRVMEETGVDDPAREMDEISEFRLINSQAMDQQVVILAMALIAERYDLSRTDQSSPFGQALMQAKEKMLGGGTAGMPGGAGGEPTNALAGGQPVQQNPAPAAPQQGGPMGGAPPIEQLGAAGIPGGVQGGNPPAVR